MIRKLNFLENGLSTSPPVPDGWKSVGFIGEEFSEKSETINQIGGGSLNYTKDCGEILDNVSVTGTQSETTLWSLKIPAGFYNVGDMMSIGPAVIVLGGYDCITQHNAPGPIEAWYPYSGDNTRLTFDFQSVPNHGFSTFTFSQVSTSGSGTGILISVTFSNFPESVNLLSGGSGYVPGEVITLEDKGFGQITLSVQAYSEPNAIVRSYWSYSEGGLDNLCEQVSLDYYHANWKHVFNSSAPSNSVSGWLPSYSEIINPTTIKYIQNIDNVTKDFEIGTCSIPDITQDIYFTITAELEDPTTNIFLGLIRAIKDVTANEIYGQGGTLYGATDYLFNPFSIYAEL